MTRTRPNVGEDVGNTPARALRGRGGSTHRKVTAQWGRTGATRALLRAAGTPAGQQGNGVTRGAPGRMQVETTAGAAAHTFTQTPRDQDTRLGAARARWGRELTAAWERGCPQLCVLGSCGATLGLQRRAPGNQPFS